MYIYVVYACYICSCCYIYHCKHILITLHCIYAGAKGGLSGLDVTRINWQKISRKGDYPSTRCGSAIAMYKQKALLFGGVFDEEG